jgi:hypothetical protein
LSLLTFYGIIWYDPPPQYMCRMVSTALRTLHITAPGDTLCSSCAEVVHQLSSQSSSHSSFTAPRSTSILGMRSQRSSSLVYHVHTVLFPFTLAFTTAVQTSRSFAPHQERWGKHQEAMWRGGSVPGTPGGRGAEEAAAERTAAAAALALAAADAPAQPVAAVAVGRRRPLAAVLAALAKPTSPPSPPPPSPPPPSQRAASLAAAALAADLIEPLLTSPTVSLFKHTTVLLRHCKR